MNLAEQTALRTIKDLSGLLSEAGKKEILEHLVTTLGAANLKDLSPEARAALTHALPPVPSVTTVLESSSREYSDKRPGFSPHQATDFKASVNPSVNADKFLVESLGQADAKQLMLDWGGRVDFRIAAPNSNEVTLFHESNNKARNADFAPRGAKTTQVADLKAAGLDFADDLQATIVCAALVKKARDAGLSLIKDASSWRVEQGEALAKLNEAEIDLLTKLRTGAVRTCSGALGVDDDGRLRAFNFFAYDFPCRWAFGGAASAESKS